jgi:hypothetical protein
MIRGAALSVSIILAGSLFAFPASAATLWDAAFPGGSYGHPLVAENVGGTLGYAFGMSTTTATAIDVCAIKLYVQRYPTGSGPNNHLTNENLKLSIVGNYNGLNVWNPDGDGPQVLTFGNINATQLAAEYTEYPITVTSTPCITIWPQPEAKYYFTLMPDYGLSTSTGVFAVTTVANTATTTNRLFGVVYNSTWSPAWLAVGDNTGSYQWQQTPLATIYGAATGAQMVRYGTLLPVLTPSNTSTGATFLNWCSGSKDFGWWSPVVDLASYLFCPTPLLIRQWQDLKDGIVTRVPLGYFFDIRDEVYTWNAATTSHLTMPYWWPGHPEVATSTLDITQAYLDVPQAARDLGNTSLTLLAWGILAIYLVVRALTLFG